MSSHRPSAGEACPPSAAVPGVELFAAVTRNDLSAVRELLAHGADVDARDARPFLDGATVLTIAAEKGLGDMLRLLLSYGADVNARSDTGWTPLMRACNVGVLDSAHLLLDAGADAALDNDEGYTAYGRISGMDVELLRLFRKRGADLL